jgi:hypothetical protein
MAFTLIFVGEVSTQTSAALEVSAGETDAPDALFWTARSIKTYLLGISNIPCWLLKLI